MRGSSEADLASKSSIVRNKTNVGSKFNLFNDFNKTEKHDKKSKGSPAVQ